MKTQVVVGHDLQSIDIATDDIATGSIHNSSCLDILSHIRDQKTMKYC